MSEVDSIAIQISRLVDEGKLEVIHRVRAFLFELEQEVQSGVKVVAEQAPVVKNTVKPFVDREGIPRQYERICNNPNCDNVFQTDMEDREFCCQQHIIGLGQADDGGKIVVIPFTKKQTQIKNNKVPYKSRPVIASNDFADPWNCEMCRHAGSLCVMHEKMTAEGQKPLKYPTK
jgi:hypothetical protein